MNSGCANQHFILIKKKRGEVEGAREGEKGEGGRRGGGALKSQ